MRCSFFLFLFSSTTEKCAIKKLNTVTRMELVGEEWGRGRGGGGGTPIHKERGKLGISGVLTLIYNSISLK